MFNWFSKKKPAAAPAASTSADSDDKLLEQLKILVQYVAAQFMQMSLIHFDETSASFAATDETIFSDAYLQGILFGLCKSLEIRNPKLKQTEELMPIYRLLIMKLAGERVAERVWRSTMQRMRVRFRDEKFTDGMIKGYGEGLTVQSLQEHEPVLLKHLQRLILHRDYARIHKLP
jgi:hypothetical protein